MSGRFGYKKIHSGNRKDYAEYLTDATGGNGSGGLISIGITEQGKPCGALLLRQEEETLSVVSIDADFQKAEEAFGVYQEIFNTMSWFAAQQVCKKIECRFTDDEPGISAEILKNAGFTDFQEETVVYRIDSGMLGLLLRDAPESRVMRENGVRILDEGKAWRFSEAPPELKSLLSELYPRDTLSFLTVGPDEKLESYAAVSELPDGSLYLADLYCAPGCEKDLSGLTYLSLGAVFLEIQPAGEFYVAAVNKKLESLMEHILQPVREEVDIQRIYRAVKEIDL